ncbi:hypothetical protein Ciccas_014436, partial [Cichlidogyrus casuarinus]
VGIECEDSAKNKVSHYYTIRVLDENDQKPMFVKQLFAFSLNENQQPHTRLTFQGEQQTQDGLLGHLVGKVKAVDKDVGQNGEIIYALDKEMTVCFHKIQMDQNFSPLVVQTATDNGDPFTRTSVNDQSIVVETKSYFVIDFHTGTIYALMPFDAEKVDKFEFKVSATDGLNNASAKVEVRILDVNDQIPVFYHLNETGFASPSSSFSFYVFENASINTKLGQVTAFDPDLSGWSNITSPKISFSWSHETPNLYRTTFQLDPATGDIILRRQLDRETNPYYSFGVIAQDTRIQSSSIRTASATVTIFVEVRSYPISRSLSRSSASMNHVTS